MKQVLPILLLFIALACSSSKVQVKAPEPVPDGNISMDQFLADAVYYGLQSDAAPKEVVNKVVEGNLFVSKCPICRPVERGFSRHMDNLPTIKVKRDKNSVVAKMMNADSREEQQNALRDMIAEYIDNYYEALQFTDEAKAKMAEELEAGRKKGMSYKREDFGKFCPSCDGACNIKKKEK